jgi:hypothetical protein
MLTLQNHLAISPQRTITILPVFPFMPLPDSWTVHNPSDEDDGSLEAERIIKHTPSTLSLRVVPSTVDEEFKLLLMMNSAGGGWLFEGDSKVENVFDKALSFVEIFQSELSNETEPAGYLNALGSGLAKASLSPASTLSVNSDPENDIEIFFNGYIPFHFSGPMTEGAELCCPPGATLSDETHYRTTLSSEPLESSYHVVWKESFGKGIGWYCPECDPNTLEDINRLNIPCSKEWISYMEKLQSGETGEGGLPPISESGHLSGGMIVRLFQSDILKQEQHSEANSEETSWYYDQEEHRRIVHTPEEWGQFVVGGDEDILLKCDIAKVDLRYNNDTEARFAAVHNPRVVDREPRTYPWDKE